MRWQVNWALILGAQRLQRNLQKFEQTKLVETTKLRFKNGLETPVGLKNLCLNMAKNQI